MWRAYTEPELVKRWWGAGMGEMQSAEIDLRVGGTWRYVQVVPGGGEVAFHGVYREIEAPDRLVNTEVFEGLPDPDAHTGLITVTLAESGGRTLLEMRCEYGDQETRDAIIASGMEVGMQRSLDSLESVAVEL
nr:SRPBCC family protein [Dactylosporangium thailandense]